ncbi:MAG TPA: hypothetical protein IAC66_01260 [Candidatus Aphodousia gallistercoris]|nr:hypothetical protein [Candidatus Aphodousia gallistercoris]
MFFRFFVFFCGLCILSLGIATVTNAGLGTGTVSSVAFVMSKLTGLTMGFYVFLTNAFFFVIQICVDPKNILGKAIRQLPICFVFGMVFDVALWVSSHIVPQAYWQQIVMAFAGSVLTGLGIASMVFARLAILPPEGLVLAIMKRWGGSFGTLRMMVDIFLLTATVILSFIFFSTVVGIREGTFITAICSGPISKFFLKAWGRFFPAHRPID